MLPPILFVFSPPNADPGARSEKRLVRNARQQVRPQNLESLSSIFLHLAFGRWNFAIQTNQEPFQLARIFWEVKTPLFPFAQKNIFGPCNAH